MSMMTLLLAFAPSAIAARFKQPESDELFELRHRCEQLKNDNDWLRAEVAYLRERSPEQQRDDAIYRYQMLQAQAMANQQMRAQQRPAWGPYQQEMMQGAPLPHCNCVPARSQSLLGHIVGV